MNSKLVWNLSYDSKIEGAVYFQLIVDSAAFYLEAHIPTSTCGSGSPTAKYSTATVALVHDLGT